MIRFLLITSCALLVLGVMAEELDLCHHCGYNCDANCNCGRCNDKAGCSTKDECLGPCNAGGNAKWCGDFAPTPPTPVCHACGYNCNSDCVCGHCNTKAGCQTEANCLGPCDSGGNAKWCGNAPTPAPPPTPAPKPPPTVIWTTNNHKLQRNGTDVVLHGLGTTCTEYLLRGIGMKCWATYNWATPTSVFSTNGDELGAIIPILKQAETTSTMPVVRIPMTASSWLGVETKASAANMAKYAKLGDQYQGLIKELVSAYTAEGIVAILDLHWNDDDTENAPMAAKGGNTSAVAFWDSVAQTFAKNTLVFYELYNEPHLHNVTQWMNGDATTAGMLEMLAAVRKHDPTGMVLIAGYAGYAYNADSLVQIDAKIPKTDSNILWNFHPYMGPNQAGDTKKCPAGFEAMLKAVMANTTRPSIVTEFGQGCQPTSAQSEHCPTDTLGYVERIMTIASNYSVSWLPWSWRPAAGGPNPKNCQDINGGTTPAGLSLAHPTDGKGADFAGLWAKYGPKI